MSAGALASAVAELIADPGGLWVAEWGGGDSVRQVVTDTPKHMGDGKWFLGAYAVAYDNGGYPPGLKSLTRASDVMEGWVSDGSRIRRQDGSLVWNLSTHQAAVAVVSAHNACIRRALAGGSW